ncbi:Cyclin-I [Trichinella pseudospiralis]|uniref:Cyclin-I n=1 Tax=Trichinella pseudospiralis TaxID=6337 RepID=A0A0V1JD48_TRIPS|nr:Cyclin-I [Trichinella pseudospiralis]
MCAPFCKDKFDRHLIDDDNNNNNNNNSEAHCRRWPDGEPVTLQMAAVERIFGKFINSSLRILLTAGQLLTSVYSIFYILCVTTRSRPSPSPAPFSQQWHIKNSQIENSFPFNSSNLNWYATQGNALLAAVDFGKGTTAMGSVDDQRLLKEKDYITAANRDQTIKWITKLAKSFCLGADVVASAALMVDCVLTKVKVPLKCLNCIALSCLYTAGKVLEDAEFMPYSSELIKAARCSYSVQDLTLTERTLVNLLDWDLTPVTLYTFLELLLIITFSPISCKTLMVQFQPVLDAINANHSLMTTYRPSMLSIAMYALFVEQRSKNMTTGVNILLQFMQIPYAKYASCRDSLVKMLIVNKVLHADGLVLKAVNLGNTAASLLFHKANDDAKSKQQIKSTNPKRRCQQYRDVFAKCKTAVDESTTNDDEVLCDLVNLYDSATMYTDMCPDQ